MLELLVPHTTSIETVDQEIHPLGLSGRRLGSCRHCSAVGVGAWHGRNIDFLSRFVDLGNEMKIIPSYPQRASLPESIVTDPVGIVHEGEQPYAYCSSTDEPAKANIPLPVQYQG